GETVRELFDAIEAGRVRTTSRDRSVPRRLRRVVLRGLAAAPAQRFADMDALIVALLRARRRSWRGLVLGGTMCGALALGIFALNERDACASSSRSLDEVWSEPRAQALRARVRSERDDAQPWLTRIDELERGAVEWRTEALALCRAPDPDTALRRACLDDM